MTKKTEQFVIVTTEHKGVFGGYATDVTGEAIELRAGRNCFYWSAAMQGFQGLATFGPDADCKIGPAADIQLRKITSVLRATPEAEKKWVNAKWSR